MSAPIVTLRTNDKPNNRQGIKREFILCLRRESGLVASLDCGLRALPIHPRAGRVSIPRKGTHLSDSCTYPERPASRPSAGSQHKAIVLCWVEYTTSYRTCQRCGNLLVPEKVHAITASASPPATAVCGTKPAHPSIFPFPPPTIRLLGSVCRSWPPFCTARRTLSTAAAAGSASLQHPHGRARQRADTHRTRSTRYTAAEFSRGVYEVFRRDVSSPGSPGRSLAGAGEGHRAGQAGGHRGQSAVQGCTPPR